MNISTQTHANYSQWQTTIHRFMNIILMLLLTLFLSYQAPTYAFYANTYCGKIAYSFVQPQYVSSGTYEPWSRHGCVIRTSCNSCPSGTYPRCNGSISSPESTASCAGLLQKITGIPAWTGGACIGSMACVQCTMNSHCRSGYICQGYSCVQQKFNNGANCSSNSQCLSNLCCRNYCASSCPKDNGQSCTANSQCLSNLCCNNTCASSCNTAPSMTATPGPTEATLKTHTDDFNSGKKLGTLTVTDNNQSDTVSVSVKSVSVSGESIPSSINNSELLAMLKLSKTTVLTSSQTSGTFDWSFDPRNQKFDFMDYGQSTTLTYTLEAKDNSNTTSTVTVKVTIKRTQCDQDNDCVRISEAKPYCSDNNICNNDAPTFSGQQDYTLDLNNNNQISGKLTITDNNKPDTVFLYVKDVDDVNNNSGMSTNDLKRLLNPSIVPKLIERGQTSGDYNWTLKINNDDKISNEVKLVYTLEAKDKNNASASYQLNFTIKPKDTSSSTTPECSNNSDCSAGNVCTNNKCVEVPTSSSDQSYTNCCVKMGVCESFEQYYDSYQKGYCDDVSGYIVRGAEFTETGKCNRTWYFCQSRYTYSEDTFKRWASTQSSTLSHGSYTDSSYSKASCSLWCFNNSDSVTVQKSNDQLKYVLIGSQINSRLKVLDPTTGSSKVDSPQTSYTNCCIEGGVCESYEQYYDSYKKGYCDNISGYVVRGAEFAQTSSCSLAWSQNDSSNRTFMDWASWNKTSHIYGSYGNSSYSTAEGTLWCNNDNDVVTIKQSTDELKFIYIGTEIDELEVLVPDSLK